MGVRISRERFTSTQVDLSSSPCLSISWFKPKDHNWRTRGDVGSEPALLTPRSRPGQMPHADLGALPTFLVYRYTMRLPGVRDLEQRSHFLRSAHTADRIQVKASHLQSGLVGRGVVGQPTAVRQALDHLQPAGTTFGLVA